MANLADIVAATRHKVRESSSKVDLRKLERQAALHIPRGFRKTLESANKSSIAIIAELKKASPSKGLIRRDFDPVKLARELELAGAAALSVLTDEEFFQGSLQNLQIASAETSLPCLRKDFIVDEFQILEARANCADAILLIVAGVNPERLRSLHECATANRLSALIEVHTRDEIAMAIDAGAKIVGINNRDLATFKVDLATTEKLLPYIPSGIRIISESGIWNAEDVARMSDFPIDALLIGEALIRADTLALSKILART